MARLRTVLLVTAAAALLAPPGALPSASSRATSLDAGVLVAINQIRVAHDLVALKESPALTAAAEAHSLDMVTNGFFAHNSSDGTPFWKRIDRYYPTATYHYWSVGENLLWSSGSLSARSALGVWMASPDHRANILDPNWRQIGIGAVTASRAPGAFGDHPVTVITADFGVRR